MQLLRILALVPLMTGWVAIGTTSVAGNHTENDTHQTDGVFFETDSFRPEQTLKELYDGESLFKPETYPELRRLFAKSVAADFKETMEKEWGKPSEPFAQWMQRHPELLEEFLTALDLNRDDLPAAFALMKRLCTDFPETVNHYPGLTVAIAVVWDQPDSSGFAGDSRDQFKAIRPEKIADAVDNFGFYTNENHPAAERLRKLPWEMLVYVVANTRSLPEREWVFENYRNEENVPARAYNDVPYNNDEANAAARPALTGRLYTLKNIRTYGGVCTARTDFALPVGRTLGIPAFYGGAGFPRHAEGHSWIMWLEIEKIEDDGTVVCEFKGDGRGDPRFYVAAYDSPQTALRETDEQLRVRFARVGKNVRSFRHARLACRAYPILCGMKHFPLREKVDFLLQTNELSPPHVPAWHEIASFGMRRFFTVRERELVQDLARRMREDLSDYPNELPALSMKLIDFPEMQNNVWRGDRDKVFEPVWNLCRDKKRADLLLAMMINFTRLRLAGIRERRQLSSSMDLTGHLTVRSDHHEIIGALSALGNFVMENPGEISLADTALDEMDSIVEIPGYGLEGILNDFYDKFAMQLKTDWAVFLPENYRKHMFRRALTYFQKCGNEKQADEMRKVLETFAP